MYCGEMVTDPAWPEVGGGPEGGSGIGMVGLGSTFLKVAPQPASQNAQARQSHATIRDAVAPGDEGLALGESRHIFVQISVFLDACGKKNGCTCGATPAGQARPRESGSIFETCRRLKRHGLGGARSRVNRHSGHRNGLIALRAKNAASFRRGNPDQQNIVAGHFERHVVG